MPSDEAKRFWEMLRALPKDDNPSIAQRREGDAHAEDLTREPDGIAFAPAPQVDGIWAEPPDARPGAAILYFYGGGYVLGAPISRRKTAGHVAQAAAARALIPRYRLAPEHPFPAAIEDGVAAFQWITANGADPARTVIMGDSAGGGLAVATTLALRDRGLPLPAGVVTISLWGDMTCSGGTMDSRAWTDMSCSRDGLLELAGTYLAGADPRHPLASPVFADFTGMPPLLCVVGGDERLIDDSVRAVCAAGQAGSGATLFVSPWMQHVYPIFAGAFPEADAAIRLMGNWIKAHTS
jgi:monoterpene epsilon-lactone hydrolase